MLASVDVAEAMAWIASVGIASPTLQDCCQRGGKAISPAAQFDPDIVAVDPKLRQIVAVEELLRTLRKCEADAALRMTPSDVPIVTAE